MHSQKASTKHVLIIYISRASRKIQNLCRDPLSPSEKRATYPYLRAPSSLISFHRGRESCRRQTHPTPPNLSVPSDAVNMHTPTYTPWKTTGDSLARGGLSAMPLSKPSPTALWALAISGMGDAFRCNKVWRLIWRTNYIAATLRCAKIINSVPP